MYVCLFQRIILFITIDQALKWNTENRYIEESLPFVRWSLFNNKTISLLFRPWTVCGYWRLQTLSFLLQHSNLCTVFG